MTSSSTNTSSSLWTSREKDKASVDKPLCYCGIPSKLRISGKSNSFGRRFYNCLNYKINKQCGFFEWIDLESGQNSCCKMTLELVQRRNERLFHEHLTKEQAKYKAMEKKYNATLKVLLTSWLFFIAIYAVIFIYPKNQSVCWAVPRLM
ncbi:hypothetical protein I3843_11G090600 [Carya illinoinensis]|nr:hypothetical protein I3843_11G090600 [Carya illinoinensis]